MLLPCLTRYLRFAQKWSQRTAVSHTSWGKRAVTPWLGEKPARRAGQWGVGCHFCAHLMHKLAADPEQRKQLFHPELLPWQLLALRFQVQVSLAQVKHF